jgi:class 3 adenylate cyclase/Tfp pilus assembly protein PilF
MGATKEKTERVLLAVLHGDIVDFSRLTWQDEEATFHALKEGFAHARIVIASNAGQLVNTAGDSLLAVFPTASAAAIAAIALHKQLAVANENVPEHQRLRARIGINLGEVIVDGDQAFGNGVNIAARLQEIAPPGGICISQSAREVIGDNLDVRFESIGDQSLRNIAVPIHAHLLHTDYEITQRRADNITDTRLAILVLPFASLDNNLSLDNMGEALTVDLIGALSRFRQLFVLASHTALTQHNQSQNKADLGQRLGVRYLVEGTLRKRADSFRLVVNLLEIPAGNYLWSETFDAVMTDLPGIQDEITRHIVMTLIGNIEQNAIRNSATKSEVSAYADTIRARRLVYRMREPADTKTARELFQKVLRTDSASATALSGLALTYLADFLMMWSDDPNACIPQAAHYASHALELDPADSLAHAVFGITYLWRRHYIEAMAHLGQAINLNPNHADALAGKGLVLIFTGEPESALTEFDKALAHNPFPPSWYLWGLAIACYNTARYVDAVQALLRIDNPNRFHRRVLAASYAQLGDMDRAAAERDAVMAEVPRYTVNDTRAFQPYQNSQGIEPFIAGLLLAGFGDKEAH